jgi:Mg-chelatase subunit ChlD
VAEQPDAEMSDVGDRRWRLLLGEPSAASLSVSLNESQIGMDRALAAVYDPDSEESEANRNAGRGSLGASAPQVARWLGDIRRYFPTSVVQVIQRDAIERLNLTSLLLEPELLSTVQPDVHLAATIVSLNQAMSETTKATARHVVGEVVAELERRLATRTAAAVSGALNRASRTRRPRPADVDWQATIGKNLKHYLPERQTVVPERLVGYGRASRSLGKDVIVAVDQSGSMAESLVYAAVFAATLVSMRSVRTSLIAFDTEIVDLTGRLSDPVEVLFGCQLGGGTDINRAIAYCQQLISRPSETVLVLISDLFEGGTPGQMLGRIAELVRSGVTVVALLALSDSGAPSYDHEHAAALSELGVPTFACTPDHFPEMLAVALSRGDVADWAARTAAAEAATSA